MVKRLLAVTALCGVLAACEDDGYSRSTRHLAPIPPATTALMASKGMSASDPILIRSYKKESELEVWKKGSNGQYALLKTFPICRWSGQLGPKTREGDRQAPEGFYAVGPAQLNPNSSFYLSFDTGYPNAFDRSLGRTGSHLMVHGSCSSRGCFAMTDEAIKEVYALARESLNGGQRAFQFQSYPFRMTAENLARHRYNPNIGFWRNLKEGADHFEVAKLEPRVSICKGRYTFNAADECTSGSADPQLAQAVAEKQREDDRKVAELISKGAPAVKLVYEDGGQHPSFRTASVNDQENGLLLASRTRRNLGEVSRPDALASGPQEIVIDRTGKPVELPRTALAFAQNPVETTAAIPSPAPVRIQAAQPETAPKSEPVQTASASPAETRSFYERILSRVNLFGSASEPAKVESAPASLPAPKN